MDLQTNSVSPVTFEVEARILELRSKSIAGTISIEEMKEAIILLRKGRMAAMEAASKSASGGRKKAAPKPKPDAQSLLDGL